MTVENRHRAGGREHEPDDEVQERRFPSAVWADEGDDVVIGDRQGAVVQCARRAVGLSEVVGLDDVHAAPRSVAIAGVPIWCMRSSVGWRGPMIRHLDRWTFGPWLTSYEASVNVSIVRKRLLSRKYV